MANAYVEIGRGLTPDHEGSSIHGRCLFSEVKAIGAETTTTVVTAAMVGNAGSGGGVARITTDDTACYIAVGTTPDADATTATADTSARRYIGAGQTLEQPIGVGQSIAIKAVS